AEAPAQAGEGDGPGGGRPQRPSRVDGPRGVAGMPGGRLPAPPPDDPRPGAPLPPSGAERAALFAFLASSEPFGFQEFLPEQTVKAGPYRLDRLYDYVMASLGPTLFAQHRGKVWAEVQSALDRLHQASDLEVRLAKTIGLLQALGPSAGVPASALALRAAMKG